MIIKDKTIFVLGAGASNPFGYPTGDELKKIICKELNPSQIAEQLVGTHSRDMIPYEKIKIENFKNFFDKSVENSIDLFLKNNPDLRDLGKKLIAIILFQKEHELSLLNKEEPKNWYIEFWNMIDHNFENINKHNMHFITFNYDRSLEHFLITALYNSYAGKKTVAECASKVNLIDIIHVYGCLAPLPWQNQGEGRDYSGRWASHEDVINAAKNLFVIEEERINDVRSVKLDRLKSLIKEAVYIYFFGFAYGEENLEILGGSFDNANLIWGTSLGLGEVAKNKIKKLIREKKSVRKGVCILENILVDRVKLFDVDVKEFLRQHIYLS